MTNVTVAMTAVPAVKDCSMQMMLKHRVWELPALFQAAEMFQGGSGIADIRRKWMCTACLL